MLVSGVGGWEPMVLVGGVGGRGTTVLVSGVGRLGSMVLKGSLVVVTPGWCLWVVLSGEDDARGEVCDRV